MRPARVGVIGGSGFYQMEGLSDVEEVRLTTPFGEPSDAVVIGALHSAEGGGVRVAFLPRHGKGHRLLPAEVPFRANVYALKSLGVEYIIGVSAVGSLRQEMAPLDMVVPEQLIDRTRGRQGSFFGRGLVAHVAFADPFCPILSRVLYDCAQEVGVNAHRGGTYVVMEGPAFSTRAESRLHRSWGADLIGMTALPEAKLAREAEMCYAILACVTDYDCWHETEEGVSAEMIIANLEQNVAAAQRVVSRAVQRLPEERSPDEDPCVDALRDALVTPFHLAPQETKRDLAPIIGRYVAAEARTGG